MRTARSGTRTGILSLRLALAIVACAIVPLLLFAAAPVWWSHHAVLTPGAAPDDYTPANQGQLKNIAKAAAAEMDAQLPDGAGDVIRALVASWSSPNEQTNDFAPVNLGQLKNVAKPFYNRLFIVGLATQYPWDVQSGTSDDFAVCNIGQVKSVFSFPIDPLYDGDGNGLPDAWETKYFGQPGVEPTGDIDRDGLDNLTEYLNGTDPTNADTDGDGLPDGWEVNNRTNPVADDAAQDLDYDGLTNLQEYLAGTDPSDYYDGHRPSISIVSGNNQTGLPDHILPAPLVVRVYELDGKPAQSVSVRFIVLEQSGQLMSDQFTSSGTTATVQSNSEGLAWIYYRPALDSSISHITISAATTSEQVTFTVVATLAIPLIRSSLAAGEEHALAIYEDGTVWAWGDNTFGQLGDGSTIERHTRVQVGGLHEVVSVATHAYSSLALRADGTVWSWGAGWGEGGLGNGTADDSSVPVQVRVDATTPLRDVIAIAAGFFHNLALKADGTVWAWGANWDYQLGDPSGQDSYYAAQIFGSDGQPLTNIVDIACGGYHGMALTRDGKIWVWGYNGEGELGIGSSDWAISQPRMITGLPNMSALSAGDEHSVVLDNDGNVWAWGKNWDGEVGNGQVSFSQSSPVKIAGLDHVTEVAAADVHSLCLKSDGTVWTWGLNNAGQLGIASQIDRSLVPVKVADISGVLKIAGGGEQSFAITADGAIWAWGDNFRGPLGNGTTHDAFAPSKVRDFVFADDPDHDGLTTWREVVLGSNPGAFSTIGDSISDGWKADYRLSLSDVTLASRDLTNKGLTVLQDYQLGTDPTKFSTVGDNIADGWKLKFALDLLDVDLANRDPTGKGLTVRQDYQLGTDPTRVSTIGDGIPDAWKVAYHGDPLSKSYAAGDDDDDGFSNAEEYEAGTNPENPDTDGDGTLDGQDFWPTSKVFSGPRVPETSYLVVDPGAAVIFMNNRGEVAFASRDATNLGGTFFSQSLFSATANVPLVAAGFPPFSGDVRLRYGPFFPVDINEQAQVLVYCGGYFEWNPGVPGHVYPPTNGSGPYFWPGDPGHFWDHIAYAHNAVWLGGGNQEIVLPEDFGPVPALKNINNSGAVLLNGSVAGQPHPIIWFTGSYVDLGRGTGNKINNNNVVAGIRDNTAGVWRQSQFAPLVKGGSYSNVATTLNDTEEVAGYAYTSASSYAHAWAWKGQETVDLAVGTTGDSYVRAINNRSQMVGQNSVGGSLWQNGCMVNLNDKVAASGWHVVNGKTINDSGIITAEAYRDDAPQSVRTVVLFPVELMVDGNRDGEMSIADGGIHDKDQTTAQKPYRFWLNDDEDTELNFGEGGQAFPSEAEKVPASRPDYSLHQIVSTRNLEDFARLWIHVTGLQAAVNSGDIRVGLKWKTVISGAPAINIYPSADGEGSASYLTDDNAARTQITGVFGNAVTDMNGKQTVDSNGVFMFKQDYWAGLTDENPKKCLLFEGVTEGKGELEMVFLDQNGNQIGEGGSVWLDIKDIKKMYERASATPDPLTPVPYKSASSVFDETSISYTPDVSPRFEASADEQPQCLVFVHGWRMGYADSTSFSETMFKRLWWQGYKGRFAAFRWATQTSFDSYNTSEWMAWKYGKSLANYVENYLKHEMPGYTMNIAAHSMGNIVTGSALNRGMTVNTYMLMQAAVPSGCFDESSNTYALFVEAEITNPTPDTAADLGYTLYLDTAATRVASFVSFFNIEDWALATGTTPIPGGVIGVPFGWPYPTNWEENQVDFKPNLLNEADSTAGDYQFGPGQPIAHRVTLNWGRTLSGGYTSTRAVADIHESLSFVARPRSKAAGAEPHNATVFGSVINLQATCNFGRLQTDHSGQFNRRIQELNEFYHRMFVELRQ